MNLQKIVYLMLLLLTFNLSGGWSDVNPSPDDKSSINYWLDHAWFTDGAYTGNRLVIVGENGLILYTEDNGKNWKQASQSHHVTLTAIYFLNDKIGWIVGHEALILKTTDGGLNWQVVHYQDQPDDPLFDIRFKDEKHGLAIGAYGQLLRSNDGGQHWIKDKINPNHDYHLYNITAAHKEQLWVPAEAGHLYRSNDHGKTWALVTLPHTRTNFSMLVKKNNHLLILGFRGLIAWSKNNGQSWQSIENNNNRSLFTAVELNPNSVLIAGADTAMILGQRDHQLSKIEKWPYQGNIMKLLVDQDRGLWIIGQKGIKYLKQHDIQKLISNQLNVEDSR